MCEPCRLQSTSEVVNFLAAMIRHPTNSLGEGIDFVSGLQGTVHCGGESWQWGGGAADHIVSTVREQIAMNAHARLIVFFI